MTEFWTFDEASMREIKRQVQKLQAQYNNLQTLLATTAHEAPVPQRVRFRNDSGAIIPAYGVMRITGAVRRIGQIIYTVEKPNDEFQRFYLVNGPTNVSPGEGEEKGESWGFLLGACQAAYNDGATPESGQSWGPKDDSWELWPNRHGFTVQSDPLSDLVEESEVNKRVQVIQTAVDAIVGKADSTIAALATATPGSGTVSVWCPTGASGAYEDSGQDLTGKNFAASEVTADVFLHAKWGAGQWLIDFEDCGA